MNLDELRSAQDAERKRSDLQPLRESFYEEAGEYIAELKQQRDAAAADADDPFSSPEVRRLTDEIETAEEVVEAIYDRRLGKLVERAALAASEMTVDEEGLTAEEQALFQDLVDRMEASKRTVQATLDPDQSPGSDDPAEPDDADGVSAADLMGGDDATGDDGSRSGHEGASRGDTHDTSSGPDGAGRDALETPGGRADPDPGPDPTGADSAGADAGRADPAPPSERGTGAPGASAAGDTDQAPTTDPSAGQGGPAPDSVDIDAPAGETPPTASGHGGETGSVAADRVTVRIVRDVGQILGVDDRQYDLAAEDVVQLPATNADPLVERGAAERLD